MKFYKDVRYNEIRINKLIAICSDCYNVVFYKNDKIHNTKNAAYIVGEYKAFYLNDINHSHNKDFNKKSWRKFVKLQAFL